VELALTAHWIQCAVSLCRKAATDLWVLTEYLNGTASSNGKISKIVLFVNQAPSLEEE
jgi:hypothetical protein